MSYTTEIFGKLENGKTVNRYTLTNENGVSASFTDLGGIWLTMTVPDKNGKLEDVILGYDTVEKCLKGPGHLGEIVGRNANRIGGAKFSIDGKEYKLTENSGKHNNLHSGTDYYRDRIWNVELGETELGTEIVFSLQSPDLDQGYPGNADIHVSYTLTPDNSLILDYHMVSDAKTIANFTNHCYFNLAGHKSGSTMKQQVWIDADYYTITDEESIPTGELVQVKGTPMDFTVMKEIGKDINEDYEALKIGNGYDHNWALNHKPEELSLSAKAFDPESGRMMEVYTDLPGVQFYTANSLKPAFEAKEGAVYEPRCGYCFETQYFPDAVNKPEFASPVINAGEEYHTTTIYKFSIC